MRKLFTAAAFVVLSLSAVAQNMDRNDISFEYIQLPARPLNKVYKNYQATVVQATEAKVAQMKGEYQQQVVQAEADYQRAYADYQQKEKDAEERYQKELADYNAKSTGKKLLEQGLLNDSKPVRQTLTPPYKNLPVEPVYPKVYDSQSLTTSYVKLEGYQNIPANPVKVTCYLGEDEMLQPERVEKIENQKNSAGQMVEVRTYTIVVKHRRQVRLVVETPTEGIVYDATPAATTEYYTETSQVFKTAYEANNWWETNKRANIEAYQDKSAYEGLRRANSELNDNFGFLKKGHVSVLLSINDKTGAYADYNQAYASAAAAYKNIYQSIDKAAAKEHFRKAIVIWEKALGEADFNNKKARVGAELAINTMLMLCEAYMWSDDFQNSQAQLDKLVSQDMSKKQRRYYELLESLKKDLEVRYQAYNK